MMTSFKAATLGVCLTLFATASWAGDADVCYSHAKSPMATTRLQDTTELVCGHAGTHTLTELAKAGWSIVSAVQDQEMGSPAASGISWMVVIQKK